MTQPTSKRRRRVTFDQALRRVRERDLQILYTLYMARALSYNEIARYWWPTAPASGDYSIPRAARFRLQQLSDWGLVRREAPSMTPRHRETSWWPPREGAVTPWGKAVTITNRGIQTLVEMGWIPAIRTGADGEVDTGHSSAARLRPAASQVDHCFLISGAVLRAIGPNWGRYQWWGTHYCDRVVHPENAVRPDAILTSPRHTWAIEADKGTLSENRLLARWEYQLRVWAEIRQHGIVLDGQRLPPVAGVLWYCAHRTGMELYRRVWRLRLRLMELGPTFAPALSWYVDSFDGLAWTWRRWLAPWTLGDAPHPQQLLRQSVAEYLGEGAARDVQCIAALGNMTAWAQVQSWAAHRAIGRGGQTAPKWCVVWVRDELEARGLWNLAAAARVQDYLLVIVDELLGDPPLLDVSTVFWRHEEGPTWFRVDLRERVTRTMRGTPHGLPIFRPNAESPTGGR